MIRQATTVFGIDSVSDYLDFCSNAVKDFKSAQDNVVRGFTAILALNHIPDWLRYKLTSAQRNALGLSGTEVGECVKNYFECQNDDLGLIRDVSNGFKHLRLANSTRKVSGYGRGPFGVGPYGSPYLLIDLGEELPGEDRWVVGSNLCERTLGWWKNSLQVIQTGGTNK